MKKRLHLLLVDDDPAFLQIYGGTLAKMGFEVLYAHNGNEATEMARRFQPDLILLDWHMPLMNGAETAYGLKSQALTKHIPIIFLTSADLSVEQQQTIASLGINYYLHKGKPVEEIKTLIKKALHGNFPATPERSPKIRLVSVSAMNPPFKKEGFMRRTEDEAEAIIKKLWYEKWWGQVIVATVALIIGTLFLKMLHIL